MIIIEISDLNIVLIFQKTGTFPLSSLHLNDNIYYQKNSFLSQNRWANQVRAREALE
jgi:hypothetical protein